ncbi:MAG: dihydroorotase [bacterium]|nr:dihydroorotase [bacterium]
MDALTIRKPDDWHVHLRDGAMLEAVLPFTAQRFGRAIVMPNLAPNPVITTEDVRAYRKRIDEAAKDFPSFTPLMTYYLTDNSSPEDITEGFKEGIAAAVKLYPAGATTNSAQGVTDITKVYGVFEAMQKIGMPILIHGETVIRNGSEVAPMDREKVFLDTTGPKLLKDFPELKIVLEHATSKDAVDFVRGEKGSRLASTITLHHLMVNHADVEKNDYPNYLKCMPVIKNEANQKALRQAATSGEPYFFLGTDSAPHPVSAKERENPAAGIFTAPAAIELYAQVFEEEGKLENLEAFASLNGPRFYGLPPNKEIITLKKEPWTIDSLIEVSNGPSTGSTKLTTGSLGTGDKIRPFGYHEDPAKRLQIQWKIR